MRMNLYQVRCNATYFEYYVVAPSLARAIQWHQEECYSRREIDHCADPSKVELLGECVVVLAED